MTQCSTCQTLHVYCFNDTFLVLERLLLWPFIERQATDIWRSHPAQFTNGCLGGLFRPLHYPLISGRGNCNMIHIQTEQTILWQQALRHWKIWTLIIEWDAVYRSNINKQMLYRVLLLGRLMSSHRGWFFFSLIHILSFLLLKHWFANPLPYSI